MKPEDYIGSIEVLDIKVDIGVDFDGQCFYYEYTKDGQFFCNGCGTYNTNYLEDIVSLLDPKGYFISVGKYDEWAAAIRNGIEYRKEKGLDTTAQERILNTEEYGTYDFKQMYKDFNGSILEDE